MGSEEDSPLMPGQLPRDNKSQGTPGKGKDNVASMFPSSHS